MPILLVLEANIVFSSVTRFNSENILRFVSISSTTASIIKSAEDKSEIDVEISMRDFVSVAWSGVILSFEIAFSSNLSRYYIEQKVT